MSELRLGFPGNEKKEDVEIPPGTPPPWDLSTPHAVVGKDHPRLDAVAKVTGQAKYAYDIRFKDLIYAKFLRSPHASAKVKRVDLSRAKAMPGVVYTEAYEGETIRFAGQQVAGVAAESEEILDDALRAIVVEYDVLPCVTTVEDALRDGAPQVLADGANLREGRPQGNLQLVEKAHAEADAVVEALYRTQVQTHSCLETHGSVCKWDDGKLTVWSSTQSTFGVRDGMARTFGIPQSDVTVITEHMGGGFGSKFGPDAWDQFCARAARAAKRPCKALLDRREEHIAGNRPDSIQRCRFSVKKDGTLMGAEVRSQGTSGVSAGGANVYNPGLYRFRAAYSQQDTVLTNASSGRAFRAPGHPQGVFALEGMIDELAEAIGMDPLELRRKNDPNVVRLAEYEIGAREIGWHRRKKPGSDTGPVKRGLGMASGRWGHNARPGTEVRCTIGRDGSVLFANGSQDIGTGTRTVIAIVGAEELGLKPSEVEVRLGNTNDPYGHGSGGSVTTPSIAPPVHAAAWQAKQELLKHVAAAVGGDAQKMDLRDGKVTGAPRELTFKQACGTMPVDQLTTLGHMAQKSGRGGGHLYPSFNGEVAGVQFAEVLVDTRTGVVRVVKIVAVQDCGLVIDPLTAKSQINGGVIQGISYALFEERILDRRTGDQVNADFLGYKIAGTLDMPEIVSIPFSVSQGMTSTGASSLGEPPTVPTSGAIGNAVANALGVRVRSLPITPAKVLAALGGAR
ncbi:MAG TPA: xanthine dehydrogenase family protein molybdopterin-binding subunit [Planctomycetota bacterium]|nr:xanthine dehydrogenase family protein molybdopterin-binding subunit [Planctomycetota bacterium]